MSNHADGQRRLGALTRGVSVMRTFIDTSQLATSVATKAQIARAGTSIED
jgi:hypothetical protein